MRTMLEEKFNNGFYETRALEIQDIISDDVQADPNKFYTYSDFTNNLYNSVGGGPQSIIGITQLMDARVSYFQSLTEFQYTQPEIVGVAHSPEQVSPNSEVWFTADLTNETDVFLAYRSNTYDIFNKINMYDDGMHEDGAAGDGTYGVSINVGSTDLQYYIYAENQDAAAFSPVRAEYEFYGISITGDIVINEFMADNENYITDQDGDYDDWMEFYNNGIEDVSLDGYYLSDDASDPYQWVFPDTTITAGSYIIVWADKDEDQEGLHANFKLSASGETIVLSDPSMNLIDEVSYLQQKADTTTGRYYNGTGEFIEMLPTFGAENTDLISAIEQNIAYNSGFKLEQNRPNPFNSSTEITFSLEKGGDITLNIYNPYGAIIHTLVSGYMPAGNYEYVWQDQGLPCGMYFYSLTVDGHREVKKMIVQ
jgi:hypothetical protein